MHSHTAFLETWETWAITAENTAANQENVCVNTQNDSKDSSILSCEQLNTTWDCSCKSKKAHRHQTSPDTPSQQRKGITGDLKSKINSNLTNKIFSKPVKSKYLKILNQK